MKWNKKDLHERLGYAIANHLPSDGKRRGNAYLADLISEAAEASGREVKGADRRAIDRYTTAATVPTVEFIEIAAEVMNVRREWLAWGEGAPTHAEERARLQAENLEGIAGTLDAIAAARMKVFSEGLADWVEPVAEVSLWRAVEAIDRLADAYTAAVRDGRQMQIGSQFIRREENSILQPRDKPDLHGEAEERAAEQARRVVAVIHNLFDQLEINPHHLHHSARDGVVILLCEAIARATEYV